MKIMKSGAAAALAALLLCLPVYAGLDDMLKGAQKLLQTGGGDSSSSGSGGLSEETVINGLKEALETGAANAVTLVSATDGYLKNPDIKIPLPETVTRVEKLLRSVGMGGTVDAFETSMNRAAEKAAPEAEAIFMDSIRAMTFSDAKKILNGSDTEATAYFKEKTSDRLAKAFKPIVNSSMSEVGVTRTWQDLSSKAEGLPLVGDMSVNLDDYVTDKALDGLFLMLAEEEKKIRQDPAARVTDLLKTVFSGK